MPDLPALLSPVVGEEVSMAFAVLLTFHVMAGLTCVITGVVAMTSKL